MIEFYLVRCVSVRTYPQKDVVSSDWYARKLQSPIPPFLSMGVSLSCEPDEPESVLVVEEIAVTAKAELICFSESCVVFNDDSEWEKLLKFETEGFYKIRGPYDLRGAE